MATRQIPWARVLVEGVVIVASILLALAADAWRQERSDRAEEREIVDRLIADLDADLQGLAEAVDILPKKEASLLRVESFLRGQEPSDDPVELLRDVVLGANYGWNQYVPRSVTFDELLSSGDFGLIRDAGVRERLSSYYRTREGEGNRIDEREGDYPHLTYQLVPRSGEFSVESGLSRGEAEQLAAGVRRSLGVEQVRAELNLTRFIAERFELWRAELAELLKVLEGYRATIN